MNTRSQTKRQIKINLFIELSNYDPLINKYSRIVSVNEFEGKYNSLKFGNGGSWIRSDAVYPHKLVKLRESGDIEYITNPDIFTLIERSSIEKIFRQFNYKQDKSSSGTKIIALMYCGKIDHEDTLKIRKCIRPDIIKYYKKKCCCVCGNRKVECDHKNDLYNDKRVLNIETQRLEDFQSLCRHCNALKRQHKKEMLDTGKRYGATRIPSLEHFGIDFFIGNEFFNVDDENALIGTYWYDPIEFMKQLKTILQTSTFVPSAPSASSAPQSPIVSTVI